MPGKYYTITGIIFFIGIIVLAFFLSRGGELLDDADPVEAIPVNAAIIFQVNNTTTLYQALSAEEGLTGNLEPFVSFLRVRDVFTFVNSSEIFSTIPWMKQRPFWLSLHPSTGNQLAWVANSPIKTRAELSALNRLINSLDAYTEIVNEGGFNIIKVNKNQLIPVTIYVKIYQGIVTLSGSEALVAQSAAQRRDNITLANDNSFSKIHGALFSSPISTVYFNLKQLEELTGELFMAPFLDRVSRWAKLDLNIRENGITLNGFMAGKEDSLFTGLFSGIEPRNNQIFELLPSTTRFLMSYSFHPEERFVENLNKFIESGPRSASFITSNREFYEITGRDYASWLFSFIEKDGALIYTSRPPEMNLFNHLLLFRTNGAVNSLQALQELMLKNGENQEPTSWIEIDANTRFPVYTTPSPEILEALLEALFPVVPSRYFSFYQNFILFAGNLDAIREFMHARVLNKSLSTNTYFASYIGNFPLEENFFMFAEVPYILSLASKNINTSVFNPNSEQSEALKNFYGIGIQMSVTNGLLYTTLHANHAPGREKEPRTTWQSRLDGVVTGKPTLVRNHVTGETEILVQDSLNNLYLINNMGRVLWKLPLDGQIKSDIHQVDYYRNNKVQFMFNTVSRLYLLDRNGNHVSRFPVNFPSNATNGIAIFDYDNNHDYRIFVALEDNRVHLFDRSGNIVPGWNITRTEGQLTAAVQHFRDKGRDYIVFSDQFRVYILDRRGNIRVTPWQNFSRNPLSPFFIKSKDSESAALVTSTIKGELATISLPSGEVTIRNVVDIEGEHQMTLLPPNAANLHYLLVTNQSLQAFNTSGNEIFRVNFENKIYPNVDLYNFPGNTIKFGVVEQNGGYIHLINSDGKSHDGFPLEGVSRFSIGNLNLDNYRFNLVTGSRSNHLFNYGID